LIRFAFFSHFPSRIREFALRITLLACGYRRSAKLHLSCACRNAKTPPVSPKKIAASRASLDGIHAKKANPINRKARSHRVEKFS
jgi:hypothetical protein